MSEAGLIRENAPRGTPEEACRSLIDLVRLPDGRLQDDVAAVVCHLPGPVTGAPEKQPEETGPAP